MNEIIITVGLFFMAALLFAGIKAIHILQSKQLGSTDKPFKDSNSNLENDSDFITIKREFLVNLIVKNEELSKSISNAMTNYQSQQNELNFMLNVDSVNNEKYDNVKQSAFEYENLASN